MAKKESTYTSHPVDEHGYAQYTKDEDLIWEELITRQIPLVQTRACQEYLDGVTALNLPTNKIPQCPDVSSVIREYTGWALEPVPALIPFNQFFNLLANRKFPAATFIRRKDELDYLQEPDIFHEIFGHCPMLTNPACAEFTHTYGKLGLNATHQEQVMLAKLYWFTIEFGLIKTKDGLRAYGGGILSSKNETIYCLENEKAERRPFDVMDVLRTPYRIDIMQPIYYVIESFDTLYNLTSLDLISMIHKAKELGMYEPLYEKNA